MYRDAYLPEAAWPRNITLLVVLASSSSGGYLLSLRCADHPPIRIRDERELLVTAWPVMTKSREVSWGRNYYPENGLVKLPKNDTRALSPAGMFGGKALLSISDEQTAHAISAYAHYSCLLSLQIIQN